ncbi:MAG: DPP IV N-terminal domain-containing protein, partial [Bacteroidota bacterium]
VSIGPVDFPDPIRVYLSDEDEIANGIAYESSRVGVTAIWVHVNDVATIWTGEVKWLRKVIAHEIAHIFHYRRVRSNVGTAQNLLADALPSFWAEGLAQYLTERWDAARGDAILRTAVFEDRLNPSDGLSPKNGRLRYAVGNSQVRYLAQTRGDSTLTKLLEHRRPALFGIAKVHDFYAAFRATVGIPYGEFYEEWRKHVNVYYNTIAGQMERSDSLNVERVRVPGAAIYALQYSPDTTRIAAVALSSLSRPVRRLYTMNNPGANSSGRALRLLAEGSIVGPISWSPDGKRIAYTRTVRGRNGSFVNDLFVVDVASVDRQRLTRDRRAISPSWAPDGRRLAFVGVDGPTANVYVLDVASGEETQVTTFTGDVQITKAVWSPDGETVAFALFDAAGNRQIGTVDVASGAVTRLTTDTTTPLDERDDRGPVWNARGDSLAFTSLRDRIGNAFVAPLAPGTGAAPSAQRMGEGAIRGEGSESPEAAPSSPFPPPPSPAERVTFLYGGAEVMDWLPPDSLHPAGRLVLIANETKRRDRVYVIDARRRAEATPVEVPAAYAAWTEHRPPADIPWAVEPDESLIRQRREYNALANLDHAITLALPYGDPGEDGELFTGDDDWGAFATSIFLEPLGKHQVFFLGGISVTRPVERSFLYLSYTNRTLAPTLTLDLYRFPGPTSVYGDAVLVEDLIGGDLSATLPLDISTQPYASWASGARVRLANATPLGVDEMTDLDAEGMPLATPEAGTRADVQLGLAYKHQRPYRLNAIHPLDGTGVRFRATAGAPILGATTFLRPDAEAFHVARAPMGRLFVRGRATAILGDPQLPQDFVGLSRFDDVSAALPFVGALSLDAAERVRGFRRYAVGDGLLFGSAEYRMEPLFDLRTSVLGAISFREVAPSLFVDGAMVFGEGETIRRAGVGGELRNRISLAGFSLLHSVGVAIPTNLVDEVWDGSIVWDDVDLYYRLQASLPF